jgi:hypothetical protein
MHIRGQVETIRSSYSGLLIGLAMSVVADRDSQAWYQDPGKAMLEQQSQKRLGILAIRPLLAHPLHPDLGPHPRIHKSNYNSPSSRSNQRACPPASIPTRSRHHAIRIRKRLLYHKTLADG